MKYCKSIYKYTQNFLNDASLVNYLVKNSNISRNDTILEIGTGKGIITQELSNYAQKVISYEIDSKLIEHFKKKCPKNVSIINDDFFNCNLISLGKYKVFSNLPFMNSNKIIKKLVYSSNRPKDLFLIIQYELAEKYSGHPFFTSETLKSLLLKPFYDIKIIQTISRTNFTPVPNVDACFIHFQLKKSDLSKEEYKSYKIFLDEFFNSSERGIKNKLKKFFTYKQIKKLSQQLKFNINGLWYELTYIQFLNIFKFYNKEVLAHEYHS